MVVCKSLLKNSPLGSFDGWEFKVGENWRYPVIWHVNAQFKRTKVGRVLTQAIQSRLGRRRFNWRKSERAGLYVAEVGGC
jgi:hypothetical protein